MKHLAFKRLWFAFKKFPATLYTLSLFCVLVALILGHLKLNNDDNFKWKLLGDLCNATFAGVVFYFLTVHYPQMIKKEKSYTILHNICSFLIMEINEFFISFKSFPDYKRHQQFTDKERLTLLCNIDGLEPVKNEKYTFPTSLAYIEFIANHIYERIKLVMQFSDILPSESHYLISMIINNAVLLQTFSKYKQNDLRFLASWFVVLTNDIKTLDSQFSDAMRSKHYWYNNAEYEKLHNLLYDEYEKISKESKHAKI